MVPRGNTELFDLLSVAFRGHTGFNVVVDRRGIRVAEASDDASDAAGRLPLGPDEIVVAEQKERADRPAMGGETPVPIGTFPSGGAASGRRHRGPAAAARTRRAARSRRRYRLLTL